MTKSARMVAARVELRLAEALMDVAYRRSKQAGRRVSVRELLEEAIALLVASQPPRAEGPS